MGIRFNVTDQVRIHSYNLRVEWYWGLSTTNKRNAPT